MWVDGEGLEGIVRKLRAGAEMEIGRELVWVFQQVESLVKEVAVESADGENLCVPVVEDCALALWKFAAMVLGWPFGVLAGV
jgi:hypothetical protein